MLVYLKQTVPESRPHAAYTITDMIGRFTRCTWRRYNRWNRNRIALQLLCSLDDRMLKDIGITRTLLKFSINQGAGEATGALQRMREGDAVTRSDTKSLTFAIGLTDVTIS